MRIGHRLVDVDNENGAVAIIVGLVLVALMGIAVLTVDIGGLFTKRRQMVTTADSAALAAAQWCSGTPGALAQSASAEAHADGVATMNVGDATRTRFDFEPGSSCVGPSGAVTVEYESPQKLFFAPALGLGDGRPVRAQATAMWGSAGGASNVVPIMLNLDQVQGNCDVPEVAEGTRCSFWYNNRDLGNAQWGFLDLDGWDVDPGYNCPNAGASTRTDWIENGYPNPLPLNYPDPTYVCTTNGEANSVWQTLKRQVGSEMIFPVNDPATQLPGPPPETPTKYNIVGFTTLKIIAIYDGNQAEAVGSSDTSGSCSKNYSFTTTSPNNVAYLDGMGCYSPPVTTISTLKLSKKVGSTTTVYQSGVDYAYDDATHSVTWLRNEDVSNVKVEFDWFKAGTYGACEPPERTLDANAFCVVTEWVGFSTGGLDPGEGANVGVIAVRLSN